MIEDDQQLGQLTRQILDEANEITIVDNGTQGVEAALPRHFEVMIADRRLPGLDGLGVIVALRRKRITTPMLILTALGGPSKTKYGAWTPTLTLPTHEFRQCSPGNSRNFNAPAS